MDDLHLVYVDSESRDTRVWAPTAIFSSKSFFSILTRDRPILSCSPLSNIWTSVAPPRVKAFAWISVLGRQNTMEVLQRRRPFLYILPLCALFVGWTLNLEIIYSFIALRQQKCGIFSRRHCLFTLLC